MVIHIFVNIAVFLTFDLVFAGYHHAASAVEKPAKCLRLIFGFMYFFGITKMSVVKRVGKQIFYSVFMPYFAAFCCNFLLRQKVRYIFKGFIALGVKLKSGFDYFYFLPVHDNKFYS